MASLKFIRNIINENPNGLQMLLSIIFGEKAPKLYDDAKTYNFGDTIVRLNSTTNQFEILYAEEDNITGAYNNLKWGKKTINDIITGKAADYNVIQISEAQPIADSNLVWHQPLTTKVIDTTNIL